MINFEYDGIPYRYFDKPQLAAARDSLRFRTDEIRTAAQRVGVSKIKLWFKLIALFESKDYSADPGWILPKLGLNGKYQGCRDSFVFFSYCEKHFGLDKSQVSRYMNVADEFGDRTDGVKPGWKYYSYSQLVELLPLSSEQRKAVKPEWTVKEIRDYKKLVATSQQDRTENTVATSQQNKDTAVTSDRCSFESECIYIPFGRNDLSGYTRFSGLTQKALCDKYLELEKKYTELCETFNIRISEQSEVMLCRN